MTASLSVTSAADGSWAFSDGQLPPGSAVRLTVDKSTLPAYLTEGVTPCTTFLTADGQSDVAIGVIDAEDYAGGTPALAASCFVGGDPLLGGGSAAGDTLVGLPYQPGAPTGENAYFAKAADTGAVWGLAHARTTDTLYSAAFLRRHAGFGPAGPGGIYATDLTSGTTTTLVNFDADLGIATGAPGFPGGDPHSFDPPGNDPTVPNRDHSAWPYVGRIALGDLDLSGDESTLYTVNLRDRSVYALDLTTATVTVADSVDLSAAFTTTFGSCPNGQHRPWALGVNDDQLFIGAVCSAETGGSASDLRARVLAIDISTPAIFGPASAITDFSLDFDRGRVYRFNLPPLGPGTCPIDNSPSGCDEGMSTRWRPWNDTPQPYVALDPVGNGLQAPLFSYDPQPLLTDIEFSETGDVLLGFADRYGYQIGSGDYLPDETWEDGQNAGDLIRVCRTAGGYALQGDPACPIQLMNNQGPGGGEFDYADGGYQTSPWDDHQETGWGGLATLAGTDEVASTALDPYAALGFPQGGVWWLDSANDRRQYVIYQETPGSYQWQKVQGLGDLELIAAPAPLQLGNRVWFDVRQRRRAGRG